MDMDMDDTLWMKIDLLDMFIAISLNYGRDIHIAIVTDDLPCCLIYS